MKILLIILLLVQKDPMFNKGRPSTYGINTYIKNNEQSLIREYEYKIQDTLYDVNIFTEDLKGDDLGEFYIPDYIIITNAEKFIAYEFSDFSKFKQKTTSYRDRTVKSVVFHELTHAYFYQTTINMRNENKTVSPEYSTFRMFSTASMKFSVDFIEEGICEYMIHSLKETVPLENILVPETESDLLDNKVNTLYCYSVYVLKNFLDSYGIKKGMEILISNKPPSIEEMLKPELYFNRLR